jgi:hypothetical protein
MMTLAAGHGKGREEAKAVMTEAEELASVYGTSEVSAEFNVKSETYESVTATESYIDPSIILGL